MLRKLFTEPESLRPGQTADSITRQAAERFGLLADGMRIRGVAPEQAAHFLMKLMFCMFAEDIGLLPPKLFNRLLTGSQKDPPKLAERMSKLFQAMAAGDDFGVDPILHFNGGLFADAEVIELTPDEIRELAQVNEYDWGSVEPSVFGTLFERTLDPAKRSQIGAHYTSREDILTLLEPVVMTPLRRDWAATRDQCEALWPKITAAARAGKKGSPKTPPSDASSTASCWTSTNGWRTSAFSTPPAGRAIFCTWPSTCCWTWRKRSSPTAPPTASASCPRYVPRSWRASRSTPTPSNSPRW